MDPNVQVPGNIGGPAAPLGGSTNSKLNSKVLIVVAAVIVVVVGIFVLLNSSSTQQSITEDAAGAEVNGALDSVASPAELIASSNRLIEDASSLSTDRTLIQVQITGEEDAETNDQLVAEFEEAIENGELTPDDIPSVRYAGSSRFATAADVSSRVFADASVLTRLVIVNGGSDIDMALASGLINSTTSVLLVNRNDMPAETRAELERIAGDIIARTGGASTGIEVIAVGGTAVVSDTVHELARSILEQPTQNKIRLGGATRYETAVQISNHLYSGERGDPTVVVAYIANADSYADIMAANNGTTSPVLLVDANSAPAATSAELCRINVEHVIVVGGENAVNTSALEGIQEQMREYRTRPDTRVSCGEDNPNFYRYRDLLSLAGETRVETSVAVSKRNYASHSGSAVLVSGFSAPDILSAVMLSQSQGGLPLLYVNNPNASSATITEMKRLAALQIFVVGGEAVVSQDLVTELRCAQFGGCTVTQSRGRSDR